MEAISYLFELGGDLALSQEFKVSKSPGFEGFGLRKPSALGGRGGGAGDRGDVPVTCSTSTRSKCTMPINIKYGKDICKYPPSHRIFYVQPCREDLTPSSGLVVASPTTSIPPPSYPPQLSKPLPAPATARPHATPLAHARCSSPRCSSSPRTTPLRAASPHDGVLLSRGTVTALGTTTRGH